MISELRSKYFWLGMIFLRHIFATESVSFGTNEDNLCMDYSLTGCTIPKDMIITTITAITEHDCQSLCAVVYKDECHYFTFEISSGNCELSSGTLQQYTEDCTTIGAPPTPTVDQCLASNNPCKVSSYSNLDKSPKFSFFKLRFIALNNFS